MKLCHFIVLLMTSLPCRAQPSRQVVDSLQHVFDICRTDTGKAQLLRPIYYNLRQISPDSALLYLQDIREMADKEGYITLKTRALYFTGYHYSAIKAENKLAFQYYMDALNIAEKHGDKLNTASCLLGLGSIYTRQEQNQRALDAYQQAAKLFGELKETQLTVVALSAVAEADILLGKLDDAFKAIRSGLDLADRLKDKNPKARLLLNMSNALEKMGKFQQAIYYGQKAGDIYCNLGNNQYCAYSLTVIAGQNLALGNTQTALELAQKALQVCETYGLEVEMEDVYDVLDRIYFRMGDYEKAYHYLHQFISLRDSSVNIKNAAEIAELQSKYLQDKRDADAEAKLKRQQELRNWSLLAFAVMLVFSGIFLFQRNKLAQEKKRSEDLLLNILPASTAEELKQTGAAQARRIEAATVMFTDFKNFTTIGEQMNAEDLVQDIHHYFSEFDRIIERHQLEKIKTIGDSYMCAAGLPAPRESHAADAVKAALEILDFMQKEAQQRQQSGRPALEIRIGLHSGPVVSGVVGIRKFAYDIWGDTVNIAARMESSGEAGKVNISGATYALVQQDFRCHYRGKIEAKNKGMVDMYFVEGEWELRGNG